MSQIEEYRSLRTEILEVSGRQLTILTVTFTATAALIGIGIQSQQPFVVLASLIALTFAGIEMVSHAYSIMRIASYIRSRIESEIPELNWETSMHDLRKLILEGKVPQMERFIWPSYENLVIVVGFSGIIVAFILAISSEVPITQNATGSQIPHAEPSIFVLASIALVTVIWILFSFWLKKMMNMAVSGEVGAVMHSAWEQLSSNQTNAPEE